MLVYGALTVAAYAVADGVPLYKNAAAPIASRVADLLPRMSMEEKIAMTYAVHYGYAQAEGDPKLVATGIGALKLGTAGITCGTNWTECLVKRNAFQKKFLEGSRLNIPVSFINEGLHGGAQGGTVFPMPVSQGASWNTTLVNSIATAIAASARATGVEVVYAPVINMMTDPRQFRACNDYF
jgi:beta-glucosidase